MTFRSTMLAAAAAGLACVAAAPAEAHPHVWVTAKSRIVFENDAASAIAQTWTFDEFYTAMAIQGLDTNNDGQYSRQELDELAKINMEGLKEFGFFTQAKIGDGTIAFLPPTDAYLDYANGVLALHFTLPLQQRVPRTTPGFQVATFDPSYFIAFELAKDQAVTLTGAPQTCSVALTDAPQAAGQPPPPVEQNNTLAGAFAEQFGTSAVISIKWATVTCTQS